MSPMSLLSFVQKYKTPKQDVETFTKRLMSGESIDRVSLPFIGSVGNLRKIGSFLGRVAQGFAREGASLGLVAREKLGGSKESQFIPTGKVAQTVFGKEPIGKPSKEGKKFLTELGVSEKTASKFGLPVFAGMAALDFTGLGGQKNVLKILAKETNPTVIRGILKKIRMSDDLIENSVESIVKAKKSEEVQAVFDRAAEMARTTKQTPKRVEAITENTENVIKQTSKLERGFVSSVKEEFPAVKAAGQYISRDTDTLAIKARNLVKSDIAAAENIAKTGSDDVAVATASELIKHYADRAIATADNVLRESINDRAADIANTIARKLTEQGRAVQAASILSRLTPEGQIKFAAREIQKYNEAIETSKGGIFGLKKKVPELTGKQADEIITEMKAIDSMPNGLQKAQRYDRLQKHISDLVPSSLLQKVIAVWKAGLLTGLKTTGLNIFANVSHASTETLKDVMGVVVDKVASLFTGKRALTFNIKGKGGVKEGFEKGWTYLKTGFDERNIATKLDYKRVNFGKGKLAKGLQKYEETIFRIIGSEDQPFYYGAKAKSLVNQAKAEAINKGLKGKQANEFVEKLIESPTDEMVRYAILDAETAVFQNKTALGEVARKLQKIPGAEFVVPFGRTPSAVATQIINYSPIGVVKTIIENIGKGRFDQRLFSQGMGRGLTGTAVLYTGYKLAEKGLIALERPAGERERELWDLEGRKPNSIKIGDKWRSVQILGPVGNLLLIGSQFQRAFEESGSPSEAIGMAIAGSTKSFTQQTFLTGVNQFMDAVADPARSGGSLAKSFTSSFVPTLLADIAKAIDPNERRTESVIQAIEGRIPLLREALEPQVDTLGTERERIGNFFEVMADPTRPSPVKDSPVVSELRRLWEAGQQVSPTKLGDKKGFEDLTPEQNTRLWILAGELTQTKLDNLFKLENYEKLSDEEKGKLVEKIVDQAKVVARATVAIELTVDLRGEELKARLSELKVGGLLTAAVYKKYLELR